MARVDIQVKGIAELRSRINDIKNSANTLSDGVNRASGLVSRRAKNRAPVDTGQLRGSIQIIPAEQRDNTVIGGVNVSAEHAMYVEFGTGVKGSGSSHPAKDKLGISYKAGWPGQIAQPFLYPALMESEAEITKIVTKTVIDAVRGNS